MDPDGIDRRQRRGPVMLVAAAAVAVVAVLVGLAVVLLGQRGHPPGVSDDDTRTAAIHAAQDVVHGGMLRDVTGQFSFQPCTDQSAQHPDGPPYNGRVDMTFAIPAGKDPQTYLKEVSVQLSMHGWQSPAHPYDSDTWLTAKDRFAVALDPDTPQRGRAMVFGECNNWTDHRGHDTTVDISDRLW